MEMATEVALEKMAAIDAEKKVILPETALIKAKEWQIEMDLSERLKVIPKMSEVEKNKKTKDKS